MNNRERNKAHNRNKILMAARELLKEGGLDGLSMRTLAERAQVSSRTPYNLFGSKTDVLLALLDDPLRQLRDRLPVVMATGALHASLNLVDEAYALYAPEIEYYRNIFWGVMTSDHPATRAANLERAQHVTLMLLAQAQARQELLPDTPLEALARHIMLSIAGLLGLWANALISAPELVMEIKKTLAYSLGRHCTPALQTEFATLTTGP